LKEGRIGLELVSSPAGRRRDMPPIPRRLRKEKGGEQTLSLTSTLFQGRGRGDKNLFVLGKDEKPGSRVGEEKKGEEGKDFLRGR